MPYPHNHTMNTTEFTVQTPSVGASPVTVYTHCPFRGHIEGFSGILGGAITTADGTIALKNVTTNTTIGTFTITQSGSAAGQLFTGSFPAEAPRYVSEDDVLSWTPTAASGSSIPMYFRVSLRTA